MGNRCIIVRYSEIALKGKNRNRFENRLIDNIRFYFNRRNLGHEKIVRTHSRIIIITDERISLKPIFGISTYSYAEFSEYDYDKLLGDCVNLAKKEIGKDDTFRVSVQRIDKGIKKKSVELEREIGEAIWNDMRNDVSLKEFDKEIGVELIEGKSYTFEGKEKGLNGLPLGVDDSSSLIVEDKYSLLAGLLMLRRGIFFKTIYLVGKKDISLLKEYINVDKDYTIIETKSRQQAISTALDEGISSIVVNDNIEMIDDIKEKNLLILRPLIYLSRNEADIKLREFESG